MLGALGFGDLVFDELLGNHGGVDLLFGFALFESADGFDGAFVFVVPSTDNDLLPEIGDAGVEGLEGIEEVAEVLVDF